MAFDFFGLFSRQPSRDAFAKLVIREVQKVCNGEFLEYDKASFNLRCGEMRMHLGNAYAYYCQAKTDEERMRILGNLVAPLLQGGGGKIGLDDALEQVVAVVRERALFSLGTLQWRLDGADLDEDKSVFEPISDWYCKALALDFPTHVQLVNKEDLERWEISFDELFEIGLARLNAASLPKFQSEDGYFIGAWKDEYDSSRVLLPGLFQDLPISGEPVIAMPNRITLMVADSLNELAVKAMLERAEQIIEKEPRPQSPSLLSYRDGVLMDYHVPVSSPIHRNVERARKITALGHYEAQQVQLEKLYEKTGKDLFVATHRLMQKDDGSYVSVAQWSKGVQTLLPVSDEVILFDPEKAGEEQIAIVSWESLQKAADDLMLDTGMFPPRYFVSKFPDALHTENVERDN